MFVADVFARLPLGWLSIFWNIVLVLDVANGSFRLGLQVVGLFAQLSDFLILWILTVPPRLLCLVSINVEAGIPP